MSTYGRDCFRLKNLQRLILQLLKVSLPTNPIAQTDVGLLYGHVQLYAYNVRINQPSSTYSAKNVPKTNSSKCS